MSCQILKMCLLGQFWTHFNLEVWADLTVESHTIQILRTFEHEVVMSNKKPHQIAIALLAHPAGIPQYPAD